MQRRTLLPTAALLLTLALASPLHAQVKYTLQQTADHLASISSSPYVAPTPSALAYTPALPSSVSNFVIGTTPGTAVGNYTWFGTTVPQQDILAFRLTDFSVSTPKIKVVLTAGQHADEQHSLYVLQGMVDFLLSSNSVAQSLRTHADFYVYPQVNPEGNWAPNAGKSSGIGFQPEHPTQDMNRYWHTADTPSGTFNRPWSNTQIVRDSLYIDTQSTDLGFLIDFHTPGPTPTGKPYIYATPADATSPFANAIRTDNSINITVDSGETGMIRTWAKTAPAVGGLNAQYAFTPEIPRQPSDNLATYFGLGETIARALNTAILAELAPPDTGAPQGTQYLVDFNNRLTVSSPQTWNTITAASSNSAVPLLDSQGNSYNATLTLPTLLDSASDGWNNPANPLPDWAPLNAADDYSFVQSDSTFTLSNLGSNHLFDIELLISRDLNRNITVTINGQSLSWNDQTNGYLAGDTLLFQNVQASALGQISIYLDMTVTSAAINALRLTDITPSATPIPEPASLSLLSLGVLLLLKRKR